MICINLKTYSNNSGTNIYSILDPIADYFSKHQIDSKKLAFCPNNFQLESLKKAYPELQFIAQNVDPIPLGKNTGLNPVELLKSIGIKYTLFNHSEHRSIDSHINSKIDMINSFGINAIVCCENIKEARQIIKSKPYAIAYEPPDLIASNFSILSRNVGYVSEFVEAVKGYSLPYLGAGITSVNEINMGTKLGVKGFIIARAFLDSPDKFEFVKGLIQALSN